MPLVGKVLVMVPMTSEQRTALKAEAKRRGMPMAAYVRACLGIVQIETRGRKWNGGPKKQRSGAQKRARAAAKKRMIQQGLFDGASSGDVGGELGATSGTAAPTATTAPEGAPTSTPAASALPASTSAA